jgi:[acyl-carrier-protein] S-malonyltransferase
MQAAVPVGAGAMAAVLGADLKTVEDACEEASGGGTCAPANINSPGQVVIAGASAAVARATQIATDKGAKKVIALPVSVPSHSPMMRPAAERLAAKLHDIEFATPEVRDIYTVDVRKHGDAASIKAALVEQLVKPVRWTQTIRAIIADGARTIIECGPGRVLTGLNRRIERRRDVAVLAIEDPESLQQALQATQQTSKSGT